MRLLLTRPATDSGVFADRLAEHRIETLIAPLMTVDFASGEDRDFSLEGVQAILLTSANGVRALVRALPGETPGETDVRQVPVYAVGDATAREARKAGFQRAESAAGDVESLARLVVARCNPDAGCVLHVAGTAIAGDLAEMLAPFGFTCRRVTLYSVTAADRLPPRVAGELKGGELDGVALFSPRSAIILEDCVAVAKLTAALSGLTAFVLSNNVAAALHEGNWRRIVVAPEPTADALLDVVLAALSVTDRQNRFGAPINQTGNR